MQITDQMIISAAGAVITLGTAYLTVRKIIKGAAKDREAEQAKILHAAKEEVSQLKIEMNAKIKALKVEIENLEGSVNKDFLHVRETYNSEIKNLGEKIENLRSELQSQHSQILQLLSKMIDSKD